MNVELKKPPAPDIGSLPDKLKPDMKALDGTLTVKKSSQTQILVALCNYCLLLYAFDGDIKIILSFLSYIPGPSSHIRVTVTLEPNNNLMRMAWMFHPPTL